MKDGNEKYVTAIQSYMADNDVTQEEMAKRLGVSQTTITNWIRGKQGITPKNRWQIEQYFGEYVRMAESSRYGDFPDRVVKRILNSTTLAAEAKAEVYDIIKEEREK